MRLLYSSKTYRYIVRLFVSQLSGAEYLVTRIVLMDLITDYVDKWARAKGDEDGN